MNLVFKFHLYMHVTIVNIIIFLNFFFQNFMHQSVVQDSVQQGNAAMASVTVMGPMG